MAFFSDGRDRDHDFYAKQVVKFRPKYLTLDQYPQVPNVIAELMNTTLEYD